MSILKSLFGKKDSNSSCCNIQFVEVKKEENKDDENKESQANQSSCCKS
ncbi:hypothetical protein [Pseudoneobacillus sp. C159]